MTIDISRVTSAGVDDVVPLFDRYRNFYGQDSDTDAARTFLANRLERDESVVFLARAEDVPAGFAQLFPTYSSVRMIEAWLLNDLFVSPDFRGRGIGRRLLHTVADHAKRTGRQRVELSTGIDNLAARTLYESEGYRVAEGFLTYQLDVGG